MSPAFSICKDNCTMKIKDILNNLNEEFDRNAWRLKNKDKWHKANDYDREWDAKNNRWSYKHRKRLGVEGRKDLVVHHKNGDIHDNSSANLEAVNRANHARLGKPAQKWEHCKIKNCKEKHFSKGYCRKHYWEKFKE